MRKMIRHAATVGSLALVFATSTTWAQETMRVRGTIERVEGQTLMVKSRDGAELKVVLADNATTVGIAKASLSDIKPGTFVGVTAMPQPDGSQKAVFNCRHICATAYWSRCRSIQAYLTATPSRNTPPLFLRFPSQAWHWLTPAAAGCSQLPVPPPSP